MDIPYQFASQHNNYCHPLHLDYCHTSHSCHPLHYCHTSHIYLALSPGSLCGFTVTHHITVSHYCHLYDVTIIGNTLVFTYMHLVFKAHQYNTIHVTSLYSSQQWPTPKLTDYCMKGVSWYSTCTTHSINVCMTACDITIHCCQLVHAHTSVWHILSTAVPLTWLH